MNNTDYAQYVEDKIREFQALGDLVVDNDISNYKINRALASYYGTCLVLQREYQRLKNDHHIAELQFERVYAEWFQEAKQQTREETTKSAKPSLKEIEQLIKVIHADEYFEWQDKIYDLQMKCDFWIRMRELLYKYDSILMTLSRSVNTEMKTIGYEERCLTKALNEGYTTN